MLRLAAILKARLEMRSAIVFGVGALLVLWALASGYYLTCHDTIVAALLRRQAEMQYAYEDRIAELRGALEQESARAARGLRPEESALRNLAERGFRLEARTDRLEALVGTTGFNDDLRLRTAPETGRRAEIDPSAIASRFADLEARQHAVSDAVRTRIGRANNRMQAALAELGLAPMPAPTTPMGGPFVPIAEDIQSGSEDLILLKDTLTRQRRLQAVAARLPLRQPVAGPLDVTSGFGTRRDPFYGRLALHTGVDLRRDFGSDVRAVAAGTVTISGTEPGYGTLVEIDHGNGYATRYAHLSATSVKVGDNVTVGGVIGQVGTSGRSTGPHLHYEIRIAGEPVDPARYLKLAADIAAE